MSVTLLVGTTKGAFLLERADGGRFTVRGPFCNGWSINHFASGGGTIWAGGGNGWFGAGVWRSTDGGATWELSKLANGDFDKWMMNDPAQAAAWGVPTPEPAPFTGEVDAVWSLARVGDTLYAGTKPATLFASDDGGVTFRKVQALTDHPTRPEWEPGAAGLTLHTIVADPAQTEKLWLGISAAGVFATEDGGKTFERRVRRANEEVVHDDHGHGDEIGYCVHNMVRAPGDGDVLYQQNHHGVWRSRDGGRSWSNKSAGLPSDFGFPVAVHPRDPETLWVIPMNGDSSGRFPPDAQAAVWKSVDGGDSWTACRDGLPQEACFFTVLRQSMATDRAEPAGVYFGTNSGSVFASADEGDSWSEVARHLPTVLCVEVLAA